jgi:hypothetical protein
MTPPPERALGIGGIPNWTSPAGGAATGWAEAPSGGDVPNPSGRPHAAPEGMGPGALGFGTPGARPRDGDPSLPKTWVAAAGVVGAGGGITADAEGPTSEWLEGVPAPGSGCD